MGLEAGVILALILAALQIVDRSLLESIEAAVKDGGDQPYSPDAAWS